MKTNNIIKRVSTNGNQPILIIPKSWKLKKDDYIRMTETTDGGIIITPLSIKKKGAFDD